MFKRGSKYTRQDVGWIVHPGTGRPKGGSWDTGYVRVDDKLIVFMNIGVAGRTSHDFDNQYDHDTQTITWYGKPNTNSSQPLLQKVLSGELTLHFFARWDNRDSYFVYLGVGKVISFKDGVVNKSGLKSIELKLHVDDIEYILEEGTTTGIGKSSFLLEKHLEDFIITNWENTFLSEKYKVYEENGVKVGRQFKTGTGPMDILAISRDELEYLVIELKRDRASDTVVGQTLRYMGWVNRNMRGLEQNVKGCIISSEGDEKIEHALITTPSISFVRYEIDFRLIQN